MKVITISKFEAFQELYNGYQKKKDADDLKNLILLFVANDDPETKKSWCPECVVSKPTIDKTLEQFQFNDQLVLVKVEVGLRDEWKREDNPYRLHEVKVNCVPTLISLPNVSIEYHHVHLK